MVLWPHVHFSWPVVDSSCGTDIPVDKVMGCYQFQSALLALFGLYWFHLSYQLVGRYLAILDLSLLDPLNLARMRESRTNISAESSEVTKFMVNHHWVSALLSLSFFKTTRLRKVLQLDNEWQSLYSLRNLRPSDLTDHDNSGMREQLVRVSPTDVIFL